MITHVWCYCNISVWNNQVAQLCCQLMWTLFGGRPAEGATTGPSSLDPLARSLWAAARTQCPPLGSPLCSCPRRPRPATPCLDICRRAFGAGAGPRAGAGAHASSGAILGIRILGLHRISFARMPRAQRTWRCHRRHHRRRCEEQRELTGHRPKGITVTRSREEESCCRGGAHMLWKRVQ